MHTFRVVPTWRLAATFLGHFLGRALAHDHGILASIFASRFWYPDLQMREGRSARWWRIAFCDLSTDACEPQARRPRGPRPQRIGRHGKGLSSRYNSKLREEGS